MLTIAVTKPALVSLGLSIISVAVLFI